MGALWFGTGIHLALAEWYIPGFERGVDPRETWDKFCGDSVASVCQYGGVTGEGPDEWTDAKSLGNIMLTHYLDTYGDDPYWEVLAPEQTFRALIPDPDDPQKAIVDYRGTFDGVIRDHLNGGKLKLVDHKTTAQSGPSISNYLALDDQASSYIAVATHSLREAGMIKDGESITGIEYNFLTKRKPDPRPRNDEGKYLNKNGSVSKLQPYSTLLRSFITRTKVERVRQLKHIQNEAKVMDLFRRGVLQPTKTPSKDCAYCPFFDMCQIDEAGGDTKAFKRAVFNRVDPYADHRHGAINSKESVANRLATGLPFS